jgi:hypothetical protein
MCLPLYHRAWHVRRQAVWHDNLSSNSKWFIVVRYVSALELVLSTYMKARYKIAYRHGILHSNLGAINRAAVTTLYNLSISTRTPDYPG